MNTMKIYFLQVYIYQFNKEFFNKKIYEIILLKKTRYYIKEI